MIGIGGNRLSSSRGMGLAAGQAMSGMALLGEHEPLWASPYSGDATARLKASFPNHWEQIRDYGFAHPEIVPFVNENPLSIAIWVLYKQQGLVFQMDCDYMCTAAKWTDVRQAVEFVGTNVQIQDGVPYFGRGSYMVSSSAQRHNQTTHTIEVVFKCDNPTQSRAHIYIENFSNGGLAAGIYGNTRLINSCVQNRTTWNITNQNELKVASIADRCYVNKVLATANGTENWSQDGQNKVFIGARYAGSQELYGKIYAIRIYDHLLTEEEILANQELDLLRFGNR